MVDYDAWGDKPLPVVDPDSEPYWDAASRGDLAIQRCEDCGDYQFYPRSLCRNCWSANVEFETLSGSGTVYAHTVCHRPGKPGYADETPYVIALVDLRLPPDHDNEWPVRMLSHVTNCDVEDVHVGMGVQATYRCVSKDDDRYLPVFEPDD